jgi:predicted acylesterase/phospholipase RssA
MAQYDTLVIAGGSTRGIAALGAIHYIWEKNKILPLYLKHYAGTSSGAIIAYLLCIGYTPIELITHIVSSNFLQKMQYYNVMNLIENRGVLNWSWIQEQLENLTIAKTGRFLTLGDVENFGRTLTCVTYNETKNCTEYLSNTTHPELPCLTALRMSCAVPILFDRFMYNHNTYIDGAFGDNFPIEHMAGEERTCEHVLGINFIDIPRNEHNNVLGYMYYLFMIPIEQQVQAQIDKIKAGGASSPADKFTILNINASDIRSCNFDLTIQQKVEIFSQGYKEAKKFYS